MFANKLEIIATMEHININDVTGAQKLADVKLSSLSLLTLS